MNALPCTIVALSLPFLQPSPDSPPRARQPQTTSITYIANEGVLLRHGESSVLIDGLFREGVSGYATVPTKELK